MFDFGHQSSSFIFITHTLGFLLGLMAVGSSFISYAIRYDVFLSFRGIDVRHGFAGNLCKALRDKGIHTFFDDDELESGEEITPALVNAIKGSRIAIPILSKNYASSSFCLDELVHIIECVKAKGRFVLPLFHDVDPSHVRHQLGSYGDAMTKHEARFSNDKINLERVQKWKMALKQVANLSGYPYKQGDGYEHVFIGKIVEEISRKIKRVALPIADYPVGLEPQVIKVKSLLDDGSDDGIHMVGIYGTGGIGKTTLALAVHNFIADHFDAVCFLENVRENSIKHGLMHLQKILLSEILGEKNIELASVKQGIAIMQHRFQRKKILLILDDVDRPEQLQSFVGRLNWFGPNSTIIITTRDKHLLECHGIKKTYEVKELDHEDAFELLRHKAFRTDKVNPKYEDVLNHAVTYASGLPLALEVIGSNMFEKSVEDWKSALDQYESIPNKEIQRILKISFDALEEHEQNVFLDIACCFKGYRLKEVEHILCAHYGNCMKYQIRVLVEKSLLKINSLGYLSMHHLIQNMGKEIVRQESVEEAGERSRLWSSEDIVQVLEENSGTSKIKIICMNSLLLDEDEEEEKENIVVVEWNGEAFKKMKKLTTLIIRQGHFSTGPKHLPNSLRVLEWKGFPSHNLPSDFHPKNLFICKLRKSRFTSLELNGILKMFVDIKVLSFNECPYLTHIDDVSGLPNLEKFTFSNCPNLITIHSSVGLLDKLKVLDAEYCTSLRSFPPLKLTCLEYLGIRGCINLEAFPEIIGKMENVRYLDLLGCYSLEEIPFSFANLTGLQKIFSTHQRLRLPSSIVMMPKLTEVVANYLNDFLLMKEAEGEEKQVTSSTAFPHIEKLHLRWCRVSEMSFASHLLWFSKVKELDLSFNDFTIIPVDIKEYRSVRTLLLNNCIYLQEIRGIPPNLEYFSAMNCGSLSSSTTCMLLNQELHEAGNAKFYVPGTSIPRWFEHRTKEGSISFWFHNEFPDIALGFATLLRDSAQVSVNVIFNNRYGPYRFTCNDKNEQVFATMGHIYISDHITPEEGNFLDYDLFEALKENEWNYVSIDIPDERVKGIGVHVNKKSDLENIRFTDPCRKRKLEDNDPRSQNHHLLKKHRFMNIEVSETETQVVQRQQCCTGLLLHMRNWICRCFPFSLFQQRNH